MRVHKSFWVVIGLVPALAAAQTTVAPAWPLDSGARIRVLSPMFGSRVGAVLSNTADTLTFRPERESKTFAVATANIRKLDVSQGQRTNAVKGMGIGFLVGAVTGAVLAGATYSCDGYCVFDQGAAIGVGAGFLGLAGGLVGLMAGASPKDTWVPVALPGKQD